LEEVYLPYPDCTFKQSYSWAIFAVEYGVIRHMYDKQGYHLVLHP